MGKHCQCESLSEVLTAGRAMDAFVDGGNDFVGAVLTTAAFGFHTALYLAFINIQIYRGAKFISTPLQMASAALFVLCIVGPAVQVAFIYLELTGQLGNPDLKTTIHGLDVTSNVVYALIDFISLSAVIYRCWLIWERNKVVILVPILLIFAALSTSLADTAILQTNHPTAADITLSIRLASANFACSMAVNGLVTIFITARIWYLSRQWKKTVANTDSDSPYSIVIAILLESGMTIFLSQLCLLVLYEVSSPGYNVIQGFVQQIYGFTPLIILIRVSIGVAYESQRSDSTSLVFSNRSRGERRVFTGATLAADNTEEDAERGSKSSQ